MNSVLRELNIRSPIFLALDIDDPLKAVALAKKLQGKVGGFKIGPRLLVRYGKDLVSEVQSCGPVFLDNKYLDIPTTMSAAVEACFETGATLVTVHTWAGNDGLNACVEVEKKYRAKKPVRVLGVTVLTSFTSQNLPFPMREFDITSQVEGLCQLGVECGLSGFVCSPHEVAKLRNIDKNSLLVTPGVRLSGGATHDQSRIMTPTQAIAKGADILVIGRPLLEAMDPVAVAEQINAEIR